MTVIVTDAGFGPETWNEEILPLSEITGDTRAVDVASDADAGDVAPHLDSLALIRIAFPSSADGRGFTIASRLRALGYTGRLRAAGHVLADQYAMARRVGFDEVEISDELAARQPEDQWRFRADDWKEHDYQSRLRA